MGRGLRAVNQGDQVALWSERMEACRASGLTVSRWCAAEEIPISSYYAWQKKLFQDLSAGEPVCFAEIPTSSRSAGKIVATIHGNGLRVELHAGASADLIHNLVDALKSC